MRVAPQSSHCSTCPPSAAVRHAVNGTHHAPLDAAEMTGMHLPKSFAVAAEHIRHLQSGTHCPDQPGGTISNRSRSSGLGVLLIVLVAT